MLEYEHQRAVGHATMPSTMYASNPAETPAPHAAMSGSSFYERLAGRGLTLRFGADGETAAEVFREHISPVVQEKCATCHVDGGASGHTRLVFRPSSVADHEELNLGVFEDFLDEVTDAADLVLEKISGVGHGGGVQVPADGDDYAHFERFLALLEEERNPALTPETLFDTVRMAPPRKTLRRATLIFAGRVPTAAEYGSIAETGLRAAIRSVMAGDAFHDFLIRGSNDRLLTDAVSSVLPTSGELVEYANGVVRRCELGNARSGDFGRDWGLRVDQGARRAPLELVAHVVENDLPYTEILTADYIMANPWSAEAYGADTEFADPSDVYEFRPSKFAAYYLNDGSRSHDRTARFCGRYITYPGDLRLDYPHAGILNTTAFLRRFPTTPTNRNRARARWTYYHFLGVDVEELASRTTDPDALADTDNPTMKNPACTGCHGILDPVAGAFQNYDEGGRYRASHGLDSLDHYYKNNPPAVDEFVVEAWSRELRETVSIRTHLDRGENAVGLASVANPYPGLVSIAGLTVRDDHGRLVARPRLVDDLRGCAHWYEYDNEYRVNPYCGMSVGIDIGQAGLHSISMDTWRYRWGSRPATIKVWGGKEFYRDGDTWYRDMREPGFADAPAPSADNSVQWLAERIAADPRFADATVRFWWPAIMGTEVAAPPQVTGEADYEGRLLAARAQHAEIRRLGARFREGFDGGSPYNLKDLLVELVMSRWFRADALFDTDPVRAVALRDAGAKRLLTPEELAAKTLSLTGVQWGRQPPTYRQKHNHALATNYAVLYGGVDGETERARELTSVMAGVAKLHAVRMSCPVVLREFYLVADEDRRLFAGIDHTVAPVGSAGETAIREKLVELFDSLLGVDAAASSPEIASAYGFFVDTWERQAGSTRFLDGNLCEWHTDSYYEDGLPQDALSGTNFDDPLGLARTWVVVLAALLMDYRYLHL